MTASVWQWNSLQTLILSQTRKVRWSEIYLSIQGHIVNFGIQQNSAGTEW